MSKLKTFIRDVRLDLYEGVAPFKSLHILADKFLTRASRSAETDPKVELQRAWNYKLAAESRNDKFGTNYWARKYESALDKYRSSSKASGQELGEDDSDGTGYLPPHRNKG